VAEAVPGPLDVLLTDPWRAFDAVLDGPLHPGGLEATAGLLDRAGVDHGTRVLDVGCGAGDALELARDRGARAVGLDRRPSGPDAVRGEMTAIPFRAESFDVVLAECVLCLSSDLRHTVGEVDRLLKPRGRLAFSDVTVQGTPPDLPPPVDGMLCLDGPRDPAHVREQIAAAGLEIVDERSHRDELLGMRDRLRDALDVERIESLLGDGSGRLRDGARELEAAVESGRLGYVSIVAESRA
jgi:SAM-dependent methyltransferase